MSAVYATESFDSLVEDIKPLLDKHWEELALYQGEIPLSPDFARYKESYDRGVLRFFTVRLDGDLIGYAIYAVSPRHLHYDHAWGVNDIIWIHPDHRNVGIGNGLFDYVESELAKEGPIVIHTETKASHPQLASLLMFRGHAVAGQVLSKRVG